MKKAIRKQLEKEIANIYIGYINGKGISDIADAVTDNIMIAIKAEEAKRIQELNKMDIELRAKRLFCDECNNKMPKSNVDSKD